jgi:hypothetical protein
MRQIQLRRETRREKCNQRGNLSHLSIRARGRFFDFLFTSPNAREAFPGDNGDIFHGPGAFPLFCRTFVAIITLTVQILLAAMLVDAAHTTLEEPRREKSKETLVDQPAGSH